MKMAIQIQVISKTLLTEAMSHNACSEHASNTTPVSGNCRHRVTRIHTVFVS